MILYYEYEYFSLISISISSISLFQSLRHKWAKSEFFVTKANFKHLSLFDM